ncbi:MAG TPA: glutaredoxin 3 [Alphaproteobacteria bacterium]|nr:glutaredoxin 3 [Alphaproteobacteria bacterium]
MPESSSAPAPKIVIYTTMWCPYCHRAKTLLEAKGVKFDEIDVTYSAEKRAEMSAKAEGRTTVPQIFIADRPIGGSDELAALERAGELDRLLGRAA